MANDSLVDVGGRGEHGAMPTKRGDADPRVSGRDHVEAARLRDGTRVILRPLRPDDADQLRAGFARLSPASRYSRFFTPKAELSDAELTALTLLDGLDHFALGAVRVDDDGREIEGLGVARFIRTAEDPAVAEAAVTVIDAAQGRGLGTLLLGRLAAAARERGILYFRGDILAGNQPIRHIVEAAGGAVELAEGGQVRVLVELPPDLAGAKTGGAQGLLHDLLSLAARGLIELRLSERLLHIWR